MQRFLNNWSVLCTATEVHFGKGTKGDTALPTLPNPYYPPKIANTLALLCTITLASLVKGEVLSPEKIRATTGGIASPPSLCTTFLPPIVKGEVLSPKKIRATTGGIVTPPIATPPTLPNPYYPSKIANTLASLVKGEVLSPEKIRATTGGIVTLTLALHYHPRFSCCEFNSPTFHKIKSAPVFTGANSSSH